MHFTPIGFIKNDVSDRGSRDWRTVVSEMVVREEYAPALDGLEGFSHVIVLFHLDRADPFHSLTTHPQRRTDLPLVGVLATRSPIRPNPIACTVARLLERRGNVLRVQGLDALDGTPVLDIKPYIPYSDSVADATFPQWVRILNEESPTR